MFLGLAWTDGASTVGKFGDHFGTEEFDSHA